jgi:hypothetical protein
MDVLLVMYLQEIVMVDMARSDVRHVMVVINILVVHHVMARAIHKDIHALVMV